MMPPSNQQLFDQIAHAWSRLPAPRSEDLIELTYEESTELSSLFVGKAHEVDRRADWFEGHYPLLYLPPAAAATVLGAYLLALLEHLHLHDTDQFVFDQAMRAQIFGLLGKPTFIQEVIMPHLDLEQQDSLPPS